MLFMQYFSVTYDKSHRSASQLQRINSENFLLLPETARLDGELLVYANRGCHIFPNAENYHYVRIRIHRQEENYQIVYTRHPARNFFKPVFTLGKNQYGRIIYNERSTTFDGEWQYTRTVINFLHAEKPAYRPKLFFRKEPDFLFEDLDWMRYCGTYHKRRIRNVRKNYHH